jgi:hypothetical protein
MIPTISPKIALIFDQRHQDPHEIAITDTLSKMNPQENIIFFCENRMLEIPSLNQYSVELLGSDKNVSTASSCHLLIGHILAAHDPYVLKLIISTIYSDPYLKTLFVGNHYTKYNPNDFGLGKKVDWISLKKNDLSPESNYAIENVKGLFKFLDENLPKTPLNEREDLFEGHLNTITEAMIGKPSFNIDVFGPISEALAFLKMREVHKKLNPQEDHSKELSLSLINRLYGDIDSVTELVEELNTEFRTRFEANKVIMVVERILKNENQDPNTIFVVRLGKTHREIIMNELSQYFKNGVFKEIVLSQEDLPHVEKRIKDQFSLTQEASLVEGK